MRPAARGSPQSSSPPATRDTSTSSVPPCGKMRSAVGLAVFLMASLTLSTTLCAAAPRYDDDGKTLADRDIQVWREMTMQILQQLLRAHGDFGPLCHHKRNSEIINSLLGLPKTMTDAGRK